MILDISFCIFNEFRTLILWRCNQLSTPPWRCCFVFLYNFNDFFLQNFLFNVTRFPLGLVTNILLLYNFYFFVIVVNLWARP